MTIANRLKKISVIASGAVLFALGVGGTAQAATISLNFDELTPGQQLNNQYSALGVTFSHTDGPLIVQSATPGSPFTSPNSILPDNLYAIGNYTQATFSTLVDFVSVTLGDFNQDEDNLYLELYDASNTLIASDFYSLPAPVNGGYTLSASAANIASARFYGRGTNNPGNTVYFDNFSYNVVEDSASVPEPTTTLGLLAFGALAGSSLLKRKQLQA